MRLRWFLLLASVVVAVIGATVAIYDTYDGFTGGGDQVISVPGGGEGEAGADTDGGADGGAVEVPQDEGGTEGVIEVAGRVDIVHLEGAVMDPRTLPTPITIESDRGFGNGGEITGVVVGGKSSAIVWDGGRPFVLSAGPGMVFDPLVVDLDDGTIRCTLGRGAHRLVRGDHQLDTPVAVGGSGIATPRDRVAFVAGPKAQFEAHGDAALRLGSDDSHSFTGPGNVSIVGDLEVLTEQGTQLAGSLDLRNAPYELTLSPTEGGGWTVSGHVQSRVVGDLVLGD